MVHEKTPLEFAYEVCKLNGGVFHLKVKFYDLEEIK